MKNILIITDFSDNAKDASQFAIDLAHKFQSNIFFLHIYSLPIINSEIPEMIDFGAYQDIKSKQLDKLVSKMKIENLKVENHCIAGFSLSSEVNDFCEKYSIDLIVMGLTGASKIDEILMGSNTLQLITHSHTPILAIPKNYHFSDSLKIAFAFDGKTMSSTHWDRSSSLLLELAKKLNKNQEIPKIHAFHVSESDDYQKIHRELIKYLPIEEFELSIEINKEIDMGILEFIKKNQINILGIIPRKHNFFDRLFHESYTKEVARHSVIPILIL